jgi:hypothetical protein
VPMEFRGSFSLFPQSLKVWKRMRDCQKRYHIPLLILLSQLFLIIRIWTTRKIISATNG